MEVRGCVELRDRRADGLDGVEVERVQVLLGQLVPGLLEPGPGAAVGGVRDRRRQHPVADRAAVVRRLECRLQLGDLLRELAGQLAEVGLAAEAEELRVLPAANRLAEPLHRAVLDQVGVALEDRA